MSRFVQGADRRQQTLLPECLDDYVAEDNPVRVVDVFIDELDLKGLGFEGMTPAATGRPAYHPAMLLKLYVYGYLNKVQSSRRLEREAQRNVELMWLTGRLAPDHKTIADFRRENGPAIQAACAQFVVLCRQLGLFGSALVAIDGSKFKAVNTRDKNFTAYKVKRRIEQVAEHIASYLEDLDTADRHEGDGVEARSVRLNEPFGLGPLTGSISAPRRSFSRPSSTALAPFRPIQKRPATLPWHCKASPRPIRSPESTCWAS